MTAVSVVIPAYNEGAAILPHLERVLANAGDAAEVMVVYDTPDDTTAPVAARLAETDPRLKPTLNTYGRGPAHAIRFGLDQATAPVTVVTMADGSDDPTQLQELAGLVAGGATIAAASRYMKGGRQEGGPFLKKLLSRLAGLSLYWIGRVGTRDATNSYKAYDTGFVQAVGVESTAGFEIGIELVAKARRHRLPVAEIPTTWQDRTEGESRFQLAKWIPKYLKWYLYAFGPRLELARRDTE